MNRIFTGTLFALLACLFAPSTCNAEEPKLLEAVKIWDQGKHNAFTDLIRWREKWYCAFREADAHVGGDGKLRVLESADGKTWQPVGLVEEEGIDLRDPHLSITPDDRLMMVGGGSVYKGTKTIMGRQPRVTFSKDGRVWTAPQRVLTEGEWLWRVTWNAGKCYGISYNASARTTQEAQDAAKENKPVSSEPAEWKLKLVVSDDGITYKIISHLGVPGHPNESTLRFMPDGELLAMVRREGGDKMGWIGSSKPPYKDFSWTETKHRFGGPNFLRLPDGNLWATSRLSNPKAQTTLARMTSKTYEPVLTLPSGGDTSYAGMVWHDGLLWVSYYSSHEGKSSIYLAKVEVPAAPVEIGNRLELFIDDFMVGSLAGLAKRKLHAPTPQEVVFTYDQPWEGNTSAYVTVFQDRDLYRMYYRGSHHEGKKNPKHAETTGYAESKDGIHWTRPKLDLFEFEGSKANNIVWMGPGAHNFTPFLDANPKAAADARYKAFARSGKGLIALKSADGVRWTRMQESPVITKGAFDSQNLAFWDGQLGKYRDYHRIFRQGVRDIATCVSDDFLSWTEPVAIEITGAPKEHLYTNAIQPYDRAPHLLIGFPTRFVPKGEQTEPTLMVSRDGLNFQRWQQPVIPATAPKDRDGNRSNYMAWGMLNLPGKEKEISVFGTEAYYAGPAGRLRRFTYRIDGFVSVHAPAGGGEVVTRPIRFKGNDLVINYAAGKEGSLAVEFLDENGKALPGFSLADGKVLQGDEIAQKVHFAEKVGSLAGRVVQIRFVLKDADLFSFRFQ